MCTYYYLHHHHIPPCPRAIDFVVHYVFCQNATHNTCDSATSVYSGTMPVNSQQHQQQQQQPQQQPQQQQQQQHHHQQHQQQQQQQQYQVSSSTPSSSSEAAQKGPHQPCQRLHYDPSQSVDYNNPCASGGCLASPDCSSGACRLEQLGGRWVCCSCGRGGNVYRWCCHPMRKSPDTFCYHVCCAACTPDPDVVGGEAGDHDGDGDEQVF